MANDPIQRPPIDEDTALHTLLEVTEGVTGVKFFRAFVGHLADTFSTHGAWITEYDREARRLRAIAFRLGKEWVEDYAFDIEGTPCETVVDNDELVLFSENIIELYPGDNELSSINAVSYMGVPLKNTDGTIIGHIAVVDVTPMPSEPRSKTMFKIFAARAAAELERVHQERAAKTREASLGRVVHGAMDAIIELDSQLNITLMNPAAERAFRVASVNAVGRSFSPFLTEDGYTQLQLLIRELADYPADQRSLWIPGGLNAVRAGGDQFPAEATLSQFQVDGEPYYTFILRNFNERVEAEQKLRSLAIESEYLKEQIDALENFGKIVGESPAIVQSLRDVEQVAATDATVLLLGDTGTGKELMAHAIHDRSSRKKGPFVRVNCAAIPATLIESEFFGHEKGAFTGATQKRQGRFELADGGTIFLDEIGELPLDLQSKLLRVLQEGEFEPVGSSTTHEVDVRVIAATNRDLEKLSKEGTFRQDLFYRLNVFPVHVPALAERGNDIILLAKHFTNIAGCRMGRRVAEFSPAVVDRLLAYDWPGNVRELQNVIERALITSSDGTLNLDRALPTDAATPPVADSAAATTQRVLTAAEFQNLERRNLILALQATDWRVSGNTGAARLLGMNPSTLSSRIKTLGIKRPA